MSLEATFVQNVKVCSVVSLCMSSYYNFPTIFELQMIMSSGLIVNVHLNKMGDLSRVTYDKYLIGKLLDYITDIAFTSKLIVVAYLESRVTLINFTKPLEFLDESYESVIEMTSEYIKYISLYYIPTLMITITSWFFYLLPSTSYPAR